MQFKLTVYENKAIGVIVALAYETKIIGAYE